MTTMPMMSQPNCISSVGHLPKVGQCDVNINHLALFSGMQLDNPMTNSDA